MKLVPVFLALRSQVQNLRGFSNILHNNRIAWTVMDVQKIKIKEVTQLSNLAKLKSDMTGKIKLEGLQGLFLQPYNRAGWQEDESQEHLEVCKGYSYLWQGLGKSQVFLESEEQENQGAHQDHVQGFQGAVHLPRSGSPEVEGEGGIVILCLQQYLNIYL